MPRREGPEFYPNKQGLEFRTGRQSRNERGRYSQIFIEEDAFDFHSPEKYAQLLSEGPCTVIFRRVTYNAGGVRELKCVKPGPIPRNAFDPRFPTLIAVIDLDTGEWRSFYYTQVYKITRILPKDLNYEQRKFALRATGQDYDKLFPGAEEQSLNKNDLEEKFEYSTGGKLPAVLVNKEKEKENENDELANRQQKLREALKRKEEQLRLAREQREKLQATDRNNTARSHDEE